MGPRATKRTRAHELARPVVVVGPVVQARRRAHRGLGHATWRRASADSCRCRDQYGQSVSHPRSYSRGQSCRYAAKKLMLTDPPRSNPMATGPVFSGRSRRSYTHAFQSSRLTIFSRSPSTGVPRLSRYVRQQSRSGPPIRARFFSRSMTLASVGCASAPGSPSVSTLWVIVRAPVGRGVHLVVDPAPAAHYARESVVRVVGGRYRSP